jgi:phosphoribosylanthranilate isomerase
VGGHVAVKVCGITSLSDGLLAAGSGADAVGFVLWPGSPRAVELGLASEIAEALPAFVTRVGVFVDAPRQTLVASADRAKLDVIQLHGDEPPELAGDLPRRVLKAFRVGDGFRVAALEPWLARGAAILLDTAVPGGLPGGTGQRFDWSVAREVRSLAPQLVLAGGLDALNVGGAIAAVQPDGVDVSSSLEASPGRKAPESVRAFIAAVRQAEGASERLA